MLLREVRRNIMAKLDNSTIYGSLNVNGDTTLKKDLTVTGDITGSLIGNVTGNADTATTLATARNIGGVSFNGSADITLPGVNTTGNQNTTGSAAKLTTARNISLSGDASGSINFDGSANVIIPVVVADNSHVHTGEQITTGTINDARLPDTISSNITGTSTGVSTTIASDSTANLLYASVAASDYFRLLVGGASNAAYAEIATADDGNEPIYARQYTGQFSTLKRTATILNESGNTSFPGTVTAPTFSGELSGNSTTATKLATARTIAGVSFNGTADISIPYSGLSSKPTTISGFGITDAYTKTAVDTAISTAVTSIIGGAPDALNTLNELAAALNDNSSYATTITNLLALKAPMESPSITGMLRTDLIGTLSSTNNCLAIGAGETADYMSKANTGTSEVLWLGGDSGVNIVSSPDNWATGWDGKHQATLLDSSGNTSFPGNVNIGSGTSNTANIKFVTSNAGSPQIELSDNYGDAS